MLRADHKKPCCPVQELSMLSKFFFFFFFFQSLPQTFPSSQNITNYLTQTLAYTDLVLILLYLEGLTMFDHLSLDVYLYQSTNKKTFIKWPSLENNSTRF